MLSLRTMVSIAVALALVLALVPTVALAATGGESSGDFTLGASPPSIGTITLSPDPMTPQQEWTTITVPVTDLTNLSDVNEVQVQLFYDTAGTDPAAPGSADVQTCAILTWDRTLGWSLAPASTTWALNAAGCSAGNDGDPSGNWVFSFKVGSVATEPTGSGNWDIYAKATDSVPSTGEGWSRDHGMNWYGEVTNVTATVSFGGVSLGSSAVQSASAVSVTYIANGAYNQQIKTDSGATEYAAKWVGSGTNEVTLRVSDTTPGAGEMVLQADDAAIIDAAVQVTTAYQTFATGTQTLESGTTVANNNLWLSLGSTGIVADTYNGKVYYQISN